MTVPFIRAIMFTVRESKTKTKIKGDNEMTTKTSSYATDIVYIWINNSKPMYQYFQQFVDDEEKLAKEIKNCLQELKDNTEGIISDLMTVAMSEVDYKEVARRFIE